MGKNEKCTEVMTIFLERSYIWLEDVSNWISHGKTSSKIHFSISLAQTVRSEAGVIIKSGHSAL